MRNDDWALCCANGHMMFGAQYLGNPLEIETWVQWNTNRKWPIGIRMVKWLMTSRDPERARSWPRYTWGPLSRQRLEIRTWCQRSTYSKWLPENQMVTWPMTSRDPERSRSWPQYIWGPWSRQRLQIRTWCQWSTYRKWLSGNQMVTWPMTSRDLKGQGRDLNELRAKYLENGWR